MVITKVRDPIRKTPRLGVDYKRLGYQHGTISYEIVNMQVNEESNSIKRD